MPKIVQLNKIFAFLFFGMSLFSCGRIAEEHATLSASERIPCGDDNGIPRKCGTDRSVDFEVRFANLMRYSQCGMSSVDAYPFFDQTKPFLVSTCGGVSGKYVSYGPFLTIPASGWVNAKVHIWPCPVSNMSMPEDLFAVDIYSASLGGILKRDVYNYSNYRFTKRNEFGGDIWDFVGTTSSLAVAQDMKAGRWVEVPVSAPISTESQITDLEVRVQILSSKSCVQVLGTDITYTRRQ